MEWLGFALSVVAAGIAFWQASLAAASRRDARNARDESQLARDESVRLASEANEAFKAQTAALERRNELAEAALPSKEVAWEIRLIRGKSGHEVVNIGSITARNARVFGVGEAPGFIHPDETLPRDVPPGDGLAFVAMRAMGPKPRLRLEWNDDDGTAREVERTLN